METPISRNENIQVTVGFMVAPSRRVDPEDGDGWREEAAFQAGGIERLDRPSGQDNRWNPPRAKATARACVLGFREGLRFPRCREVATMGASYGALYVRTDERHSVRAAVERVAREQGTKFLLAPALRGWVGVYPEGYGHDDRPVQAIAESVGGDALHVYLHDESLLGYTYYRDGRIEDAYCSDPSYLDIDSPAERERVRGRPERLAGLLPRSGSVEELDRVLHPPDGGPLFKSFALRRLANLLRLPNALTCYEYLTEDEPPFFKAIQYLTVRGRARFLHVPDLADERRAEQGRRAAKDDRFRRLRDEGILHLHERGRRGWVLSSAPHVGPDRRADGFLVTWENTWRPRLSSYAPPWRPGGVPSGLTSEGVPTSISLSPSGRLLAAGHSYHPFMTELFDLDRPKQVRRIESGSVLSLDFSRDERHLLIVTGEGLVIVDLVNGDEVRRTGFKSDLMRGIFDPSGRYAVLVCGGRLDLYDWEAGQRIRRWKFESQPGEDSELERTARSGGTEDLARPSSEALSHIDFSGDGRLLLCGTDRGARVFEWQELLDLPEPTLPEGRRSTRPRAIVAPPPLFTAPGLPYQEDGEAEFTGSGRDIFATAYDPAGERFLFAGMGGMIGCLDLRTGRVRDLVEVPGRPVIGGLTLSRDGSALACVTIPHFYRSSSNLPQELLVWNYRALVGRVTAANGRQSGKGS
jgi:hypothetical protein